jgi:hypothetical protein
LPGHGDGFSENQVGVNQSRSAPRPQSVKIATDISGMTILRIKAKSTGRRVSWAGLKENRLVAPSHAFAMTVTLPDVITDVQDLCNSIDPD